MTWGWVWPYMGCIGCAYATRGAAIRGQKLPGLRTGTPRLSTSTGRPAFRSSSR